MNNLLKNILAILKIIFWLIMAFVFYIIYNNFGSILKYTEGFKVTRINIGTSGANVEISNKEEQEPVNLRLLKKEELSDNRDGKTFDKKKVETESFVPKNFTELYYKNMNELLKIKNPTNIEFDKIELTKWVRDSDPFYTLILSNTSKMPAKNIKYELLLNGKFKKSKTSNIFYKGFTLKGGKSFKIPIVTKDDLAKYFNINKEQVLGMGLSINISNDYVKLAKVIKKENTLGIMEYKNLRATSFPIKYTYETIFGDKIQVTTELYVYIDKN